MRQGLSTLLLAVSLCAASPGVLATDYTGLAGGSGGSGFDLDCGANMSLIGIQGKAGSLIDSVQGVCAQFNADGTKLGSNVLTGKAGGAGGASYDLQCLNGTTVQGITGHTGAYVNDLKLRCSGTTPAITESAGRATGSWFAQSCPVNMDARLIRGRSGLWVDAIGLGCKAAQRLRVGAVSIASAVRVGQAAPLTVTMSLVPVENISVRLNSSNERLVPTPGVVTVGSTTTKATATVAASEMGCARITASYKGSSASADMVVHGAASPGISVKGPATIGRYGPGATLTVSIPSPSPVYTAIVLSVGGPVGLSGPAVYLSSTVVSIAPNAVSTTFQVQPRHLGCSLIDARVGTGGGAKVTHAIMVVE